MEQTNIIGNNMMQFSLYENLKTGNIIIDMVLSTIAISLFTSLGIFLKETINIRKINKYLKFLPCYRNRNSVLLEGYYVVRSWNGTVKTDFPIILDALFWYIGNKKFEKEINNIKLHIPSLETFLNMHDDNGDGSVIKDQKDKLRAEVVKKKLVFRPQKNTHFMIDDIQVELYEDKIESEKSIRENLLYNLKIYLKDNTCSTNKIKSWLEKIQYQYESYQKNQLDKQKKIFTMLKQEEHIEWYEEDFISGKTWDNLFCTNKDVIKKKLDFFINNRKWYKKRGIPWTFGVLTYGPPGCGKTSLEKVFLNYLNRHGVQLNIDENTSYKDIRELFYNPYINGKYVPLKNRVYIIPDIDAMGKVLLKRTESNTDINNASSSNKNNNLSHFIEENRNKEDLELEITFLKNEKKILQNKLKENIEQNEKKMRYKSDYSPQKSANTPGSKTSISEASFIDLMKKKNQSISLSQILNLLDGIVELDGRVLIACTNHINKLDPALIRPGRIDCVVELGLCTHQMIKDIMENFYETEVSFKQLEKIAENYFTPCKIYEICFRNTENINKALCTLENSD